jgi:hypothetical protein
MNLCRADCHIWQTKRTSNAHDKQEEWKNKVGWRTTVPFGMAQWRIDIGPTAWCIHQDHHRNGHSPKDIKGEISLYCFHYELFL